MKKKLSDVIKSANKLDNLIEIKYPAKNYDDNFDINSIITICRLYNDDSFYDIDITESEILPVKENEMKKLSRNKNVIYEKEFIKRYNCFIKIFLSALLLDIDIVKKKSKGVSFVKNITDLIESFATKKKELIAEKKDMLKQHIDDMDDLSDQFQNFCNNSLILIADLQKKTNVIDSNIHILSSFIEHKIIEPKSNILQLVLPYLYKYCVIVEEYNV